MGQKHPNYCGKPELTVSGKPFHVGDEVVYSTSSGTGRRYEVYTAKGRVLVVTDYEVAVVTEGKVAFMHKSGVYHTIGDLIDAFKGCNVNKPANERIDTLSINEGPIYTTVNLYGLHKGVHRVWSSDKNHGDCRCSKCPHLTNDERDRVEIDFSVESHSGLGSKPSLWLANYGLLPAIIKTPLQDAITKDYTELRSRIDSWRQYPLKFWFVVDRTYGRADDNLTPTLKREIDKILDSGDVIDFFHDQFEVIDGHRLPKEQ